LWIIPLYLWEALLEPFFPTTHALIGDWFSLINFGTLFVYGFLLISCGDVFWQHVIRFRRRNVLLGIGSFAALLIIWQFEDGFWRHFTEAALKVFNLWTWIFVLFGYAAVYLNRPSRILRYCNRAVYPFYILHQTIILLIAYHLMNLDWGFWPKFMILTLGTFGGSWAVYQLIILPLRPLHALFGLKPKTPVIGKAESLQEK
jgi:hypothetical protein